MHKRNKGLRCLSGGTGVGRAFGQGKSHWGIGNRFASCSGLGSQETGHVGTMGNEARPLTQQWLGTKPGWHWRLASYGRRIG